MAGKQSEFGTPKKHDRTDGPPEERCRGEMQRKEESKEMKGAKRIVRMKR
jgi:hypothetical protein